MTILSSAALKEKIRADGQSVHSFGHFMKKRGYNWKDIDSARIYRERLLEQTRTLIVERLTWADGTFTDLTDMTVKLSMAGFIKVVEAARSEAFWRNPAAATKETLGVVQKDAAFKYHMDTISLAAVARFGKYPAKIRFYCQEDEEASQRAEGLKAHG